MNDWVDVFENYNPSRKDSKYKNGEVQSRANISKMMKDMIEKCKELGIEHKIEYRKKYYNHRHYKILYVRQKDLPKIKAKKNSYEYKCLTIIGKSFEQCLKDIGITYLTFIDRIRRGWTFNQAIFTPKGGIHEESQKCINRRDKSLFMAKCAKKRYR